VLLGRKVNVRPTKSAAELSSIVQETREKVAHKIRSSKEQQQQQDQEKTAKKKPSPIKKAQSTKATAPTADSPAVGADGERKLTKKERNRRAAILRQKGRHGRR
jgi:Tfp pilus assembly protein PilP